MQAPIEEMLALEENLRVQSKTTRRKIEEKSKKNRTRMEKLSTIFSAKGTNTTVENSTLTTGTKTTYVSNTTSTASNASLTTSIATKQKKSGTITRKTT